eukprot:TRINITY_DN2224_c1_g1_i1.p1 TRINITY_DN2224_c1_g1~~TRINITY_DN2224_c1_g1_i1.p1  ORF type:complete len:562 (-),score=77.75 TRINITY_DN2224_c1_g1_i1:35-1720(-)
MDWDIVQSKTFVNWVGSHLNTQVSDISTFFSDGIQLLRLIEVLFPGTSIPRYSTAPTVRAQKLDNVTQAINILQSKGISLPFLKASNVVDGDAKMILGMLWTLLLETQVKDSLIKEKVNHNLPSYDELVFGVKDLPQARDPVQEKVKTVDGTKEVLLEWVRREVSPYDIPVDNLHSSFKDGRIFAALVHSLEPECIDLEEVLKLPDLDRNHKAFAAAYSNLRIFPLLDPADIQAGYIDERSVMLYLSELVKYYNSPQKLSKDLEREFARARTFAPTQVEMPALYPSLPAPVNVVPAAPVQPVAEAALVDVRSPSNNLPPGWEIRTDPSGRSFYVDHNTKSTTYYPPWSQSPGVSLPPGWESRLDAQGRMYFVDHNTRTTSYHMPGYQPLQQYRYVQPSGPSVMTMSSKSITLTQNGMTTHIPVSGALPKPKKEKKQKKKKGQYSSMQDNDTSATVQALGSPSQGALLGNKVYVPPAAVPMLTSAIAQPVQTILPRGWSFKYDPQGRPYYLDHHSQTTTYTPPPIPQDQLPPGWEVRRDANGKSFYMNHQAKTTQWHPPPLS